MADAEPEIKEVWSLYVKTPEYDPYFAVSEEGEVWFRGEHVDTDTKLAAGMNAVFLRREPRKVVIEFPESVTSVNSLFGVFIDATQD